VRNLLAIGLGLTVLATSREPLHVEGEGVVMLGPLPVADDAVQLVVDRVRAPSSQNNQPEPDQTPAQQGSSASGLK
jgi:predicted ATPase